MVTPHNPTDAFVKKDGKGEFVIKRFARLTAETRATASTPESVSVKSVGIQLTSCSIVRKKTP